MMIGEPPPPLLDYRAKRPSSRRALLARHRRDDHEVSPSSPRSRCAPRGTMLARSDSRGRCGRERDAFGGSTCGAARAQPRGFALHRGRFRASAAARDERPSGALARTIWQPLAALATTPSRPRGRRTLKRPGGRGIQHPAPSIRSGEVLLPAPCSLLRSGGRSKDQRRATGGWAAPPNHPVAGGAGIWRTSPG
jgi:hypothetical protein